MATGAVEKVPLNDLRRGYLALRDELREAATRVMESGWYVHGPEHALFEEEFASFLGNVACVGVGNGTDALEIALRSLDLPPSSVVVTAANAGMYASTAILRADLRPRYADVDDDSHLLSPEKLANVLNDSVAAVIVTHLYGRLADTAAIDGMCRPRGIRVLEDCAQAVGAGGQGNRAGTIGDLSAFSFYPTKNLGALGDGGMVVSREPSLAERAGRLRQYGWREKYLATESGGRNSRLDELQAAVLRVRLPYVDGWNERRRYVIGRYAEAAAGTAIRVLPAVGENHVGHLAVAVTLNREDVRERLRFAGIQTDVHYPVPDHLQPAIAGQLEWGPGLPVTEDLSRRILSLPCFPELTEDEIDRVCDALATF